MTVSSEVWTRGKRATPFFIRLPFPGANNGNWVGWLIESRVLLDLILPELISNKIVLTSEPHDVRKLGKESRGRRKRVWEMPVVYRIEYEDQREIKNTRVAARRGFVGWWSAEGLVEMEAARALPYRISCRRLSSCRLTSRIGGVRYCVYVVLNGGSVSVLINCYIALNFFMIMFALVFFLLRFCEDISTNYENIFLFSIM